MKRKNLIKVTEIERRENGKVWAKLKCGHSRLLDGNTLNASHLRCLDCENPSSQLKDSHLFENQITEVKL